MKKQHLGLPVMLATIVLTGFGCGSITSKITEKVTEKVAESVLEKSVEGQTNGKVDLDVNNGTLNFKGEDGTSVSYGSDLKLPSDFPSVVPVYQSAKIVATTTTSAESTVTLTTEDKADVIIAWYQEQLKDWKKEQSFDSQGYYMRVYSRNNETITVAVGDSDTTRSITVHYTMEVQGS